MASIYNCIVVLFFTKIKSNYKSARTNNITYDQNASSDQIFGGEIRNSQGNSQEAIEIPRNVSMENLAFAFAKHQHLLPSLTIFNNKILYRRRAYSTFKI